MHRFFLSRTCMLSLFAVIFLSQPYVLYAAEPSAPSPERKTLTEQVQTQVDVAGESAGLQKEDPRQYIGRVISIVLGFMGMLFLVLIVYAGYVRLTSHGEEDRIKKSTSTAVAAMLGLVIVLLAYGITKFVTSRVYNAATYDPVYEENNQAPDTIYKKSIHIKLF